MNFTTFYKIFILILVAILLFSITACSNNADRNNKDNYSYSVNAVFMLSQEVETGISMDISSIKYHDDYSNSFTNLLGSSKITAVLEKYGFPDYKNIEISSANDTNTIYTVTFFSNEQKTIVSFGNEVCALLQELILHEYNCVIEYIHLPTVNAINKLK